MNNLVPITNDQIGQAGAAANHYAALHSLEDYQKGLAPNTQERQKDALVLLAAYYDAIGLLPSHDVIAASHAFYSDIIAWRGMTWGLVSGFKRWMEQRGLAIGSINVHLSTVRNYCKLAQKAGMLTENEFASITLVKGYKQSEGKNVDRAREVSRVGNKKAESLILDQDQVARLKNQPDTVQGRRDTVMLCFLLDQGLRCGELAELPFANIDMQARRFLLHRPKVDKAQTHNLLPDTYQALVRYLEIATPQDDLLLGSTIDGKELIGRMSERAIHQRVKDLGRRSGIEHLSPHDCRHTWATRAARGKTDTFVLQEAGGWRSLQMPRRYVERNAIANEGVILDKAQQ